MKFERLRRFDFARDGLTLAAYDSGGDGLPVVFQHGLCGDVNQTVEVFPDRRGLRLIALECRGHGASEAGVAFSIAMFADDVIALMDHLGLRSAAIGGISMGAAIASRIAVHYPERINALILGRPAWVTEARPDNLSPNAEVGALLARHSPDEARSAFIAGRMYALLAREAPDNLSSLLGFFEREPIAVTAALLSAIAADGPGITADDLALLSMPTLVLSTEKDFIHPVAHAQSMARLIPRAALESLTPKSVDKAAYVADFKAALATFLEDL